MTQIVGAVGVIASLSIVSWQSRQLVKQMKISNSMTTLAVMNSGLDRLHSFLGRLADEPHLRPYFYGGLEVDGSDELLKDKVLAIAEMLADILDYGLTSAAYLPSVKEQDDWSDFVIYCLERSPALRQLVEGNPDEWWKEIAKLRSSYGPVQPFVPEAQPAEGERDRRRSFWARLTEMATHPGRQPG